MRRFLVRIIYGQRWMGSTEDDARYRTHTNAIVHTLTQCSKDGNVEEADAIWYIHNWMDYVNARLKRSSLYMFLIRG